ncbi:MAG: mammalian cell entry protein [Candidatus Sericytochromatia bacterium]
MTTTESQPNQAVRRRAVRAAGPANGGTVETTAVRLESPPEEKRPARKPIRKAGPPPRRPAHRRLVAIVALAFGVLAVAGLATAITFAYLGNRDAQASQQRDQQFVDTASQLAVNMYTFNQNSVEDSVKQVVNNTSGPLHDMLARDNHTEVLEQFFRSMGGSSEAVVTGAALESKDPDTNTATVLVSVRVTTTDANGNNQPSTPSRMRITVQQDDNGRMTGYDLKWPDGGN